MARSDFARAKTAAERRANVLQQYPGLGMEFTLNDRVATYVPAAPAAAKPLVAVRVTAA